MTFEKENKLYRWDFHNSHLKKKKKKNKYFKETNNFLKNGNQSN